MSLFWSRNQATAKWKAEASVVLIRRCPECRAPNPRAEDHCPACGAEAPMPLRQPVLNDAAVLNRLFPWHGRALLSIGAGLMRFAKWIEGGPK